MADVKQNTEKLLTFVGTKVQNNELDNDSLVQLIEVAGSFLNLQTIPDYCERTGMSYNGVKNGRKIIQLFGCKFVIDNE